MNATVIYDNKPKAIELNLTGQDNRCVSFFEGVGHWQRGVKGLTLLRKTSIISRFMIWPGGRKE